MEDVRSSVLNNLQLKMSRSNTPLRQSSDHISKQMLKDILPSKIYVLIILKRSSNSESREDFIKQNT